MAVFAKSVVALALVTIPSTGFACSVIMPPDYEGSAKQLRDVRAAIASSPAIIDGEVIRPYVNGRQNALVRVRHILKGNPPATIEVGMADTCSITLDRIGERSRMILFGGPQVFQLYRDQSEARVEDRILKSDRRKIWPYHAGLPNAPK